MDEAYEDDDGSFVGYVPETNDPGQLFLSIVIVVFLFVLVTLPLTVILGEKHDELQKLKSAAAATRDNSETDEDDVDQQQHSAADLDDDEDNESVLSRRSYISEVFTGALREIRDIIEQQPGRTTKTKGIHRRHRRLRHRDAPNNSTGGDGVPPVDMVISTSFETQGTKEPSLAGDDEANGLSIEGSVLDGNTSNRVVAYIVDDTVIDRTVCYTMDGILDEVAAIMNFDHEMKRIIKLSLPFATQAIFTGVLDIMSELYWSFQQIKIMCSLSFSSCLFRDISRP